jgi:NTE family protein
MDLLMLPHWNRKLRIGLALGGGAARGLAHLGVLRVLEREQIPIDVLVGTSMGAIIGGAWAAGRDVEALEAKVRTILTSEAFRRNRLNFLRESQRTRGGLLFSMANLMRKGIFYGVSTLRPSFLSAEEFAGSMEAILPDTAIEGLPVRFGAVALDIEAGHEVVMTSGSLRQAARASSAIPGILPPVRIEGRTLIDGGWVDKVPVLPAFKLGADVVIAVDITPGLDPRQAYTRGVDIMVRANAIKDSTLVGHLRRLADIVITPDINGIHWADFGAWRRCLDAGQAATEQALPRIQELLRRERFLSILRPAAGKRLAQLYLGGELEAPADPGGSSEET